MKKALLLFAIIVTSSFSIQAQEPTDPEWVDFWSDFKGAVSTGIPEKIWDFILFPIPTNDVDQESFLTDFNVYFPPSTLSDILELDATSFLVVNNYLSNMDTNDDKLVKVTIDQNGVFLNYYFGRVEDTIYLLDIK